MQSLSPGRLQVHSLRYICFFDPFLATHTNKLAKPVLLSHTLNSTDCLKQLHWLPRTHDRIIFKNHPHDISNSPIHPISISSFSAATHLVFVHPPLFNYANQFTNHPSSREASHMPLLLPGTHHLPSQELNHPWSSSRHLFRTPT